MVNNVSKEIVTYKEPAPELDYVNRALAPLYHGQLQTEVAALGRELDLKALAATRLPVYHDAISRGLEKLESLLATQPREFSAFGDRLKRRFWVDEVGVLRWQIARPNENTPMTTFERLRFNNLIRETGASTTGESSFYAPFPEEQQMLSEAFASGIAQQETMLDQVLEAIATVDTIIERVHPGVPGNTLETLSKQGASKFTIFKKQLPGILLKRLPQLARTIEIYETWISEFLPQLQDQASGETARQHAISHLLFNPNSRRIPQEAAHAALELQKLADWFPNLASRGEANFDGLERCMATTVLTSPTNLPNDPFGNDTRQFNVSDLWKTTLQLSDIERVIELIASLKATPPEQLVQAEIELITKKMRAAQQIVTERAGQCGVDIQNANMYVASTIIDLVYRIGELLAKQNRKDDEYDLQEVLEEMRYLGIQFSAPTDTITRMGRNIPERSLGLKESISGNLAADIREMIQEMLVSGIFPPNYRRLITASKLEFIDTALNMWVRLPREQADTMMYVFRPVYNLDIDTLSLDVFFDHRDPTASVYARRNLKNLLITQPGETVNRLKQTLFQKELDMLGQADMRLGPRVSQFPYLKVCALWLIEDRYVTPEKESRRESLIVDFQKFMENSTMLGGPHLGLSFGLSSSAMLTEYRDRRRFIYDKQAIAQALDEAVEILEREFQRRIARRINLTMFPSETEAFKSYFIKALGV